MDLAGLCEKGWTMLEAGWTRSGAGWVRLETRWARNRTESIIGSRRMLWSEWGCFPRPGPLVLITSSNHGHQLAF